jgi:hypothetical protein
MDARSSGLAATDIALCVIAPLLLAILEIFHPHVHDPMSLDLRPWMTVHYAQIPLFALVGLGVVTLLRGHGGIAAAACRLAMFVFVVSYIPFDTAAGIVTGTLVDSARASGLPDAWRPAIEAVWNHPIVGGSSTGTAPPLLAALGAIAWSIGTIAAAISLKRAGASLWPCLLLGASGFGLAIFRTHAWPGGPVTFGGLALAAAWILWGRRRAPHAVSQ